MEIFADYIGLRVVVHCEGDHFISDVIAYYRHSKSEE